MYTSPTQGSALHVGQTCVDGKESNPHISKMHNVQETQKNCFKNKLEIECLLLLFCHFYRLYIRILVQAVDTL